MKRLWIIPFFLSLGACDRDATPLAAYRRPTDALASVLPLAMLGIYPCASLEKRNGTRVIVGVPVDQCYKMRPKQRFRGIWLDEFEGSTFFEAALTAESVKAEVQRRLRTKHSSNEWLDWAGTARKGVPSKNSPNSRMVALDFVGRRTAYPGSYGHMGMSSGEVVVDRVVSAHVIYQSNEPYLEYELSP
jgi:hypothetical protein